VARRPGPVVVLGSRFGGLAVIRGLRRLFGRDLSITLVTVEQEGPYTPDLVFAAAGWPARADQSRISLGRWCQRLGVRVVEDAAMAIDAAGQRVHLLSGGTLGYETLFWATGMDVAPELMPGWPGHGWAVCQDFAAYAAGKAAGGEELVLAAGPLYQDPTMRPALAAACECPLYEVALLASQRRRPPPPRRVTVVTPANQIGQEMGPKARAMLLRLLKQAGVETVVGARYLGIEGGRLWLADRGPLSASRLLVMPPTAGSRLARASGLDDGFGWVPTNGYLQHKTWPNIYAVGDLNRLSLPKMGHTAMVQAWVAVRHFAAGQGRHPMPPPYRPLMVGAMWIGQGRALAVVQNVIYGGQRQWAWVGRPPAWVKQGFGWLYRRRPGSFYWLP
jgi:sulfide:quinone oxidoreductase